MSRVSPLGPRTSTSIRSTTASRPRASPFSWQLGRIALATANAVRARLGNCQTISRMDCRWCIRTTRRLHNGLDHRSGQDLVRGYRARLPGDVFFLQNIRATIIPTIAVPVVFWGLSVYGGARLRSIRCPCSAWCWPSDCSWTMPSSWWKTSSVSWRRRDFRRSRRRARPWGRSAALIGVAVVLSAVFVPVAFSSGTVGAIYRQFSLRSSRRCFVRVRRAHALSGIVRDNSQAAPRTACAKRGFFGWFNRGRS